MITVLAGENSFENERALSRIVSSFDGEPERFDGEMLELKQLPDLLMGMSLFATRRLVVIKNMSANKTVWNSFETWIEKVSDDIHLVLVDAKPDKRTKTYKVLQKSAGIKESKLWTERDTSRVEQWVLNEAAVLGLEVDKKSAHLLVARAGVDQWALWDALQKLAALGEVTPQIIEDVIEPNATENVFGLLEAALKSDTAKVRRMLEILEKVEDPYKIFGLLSSQVFQLAVVSVADTPPATIAGDLGVHPFVISKLTPFSQSLGKANIKAIVHIFADGDRELKTSAADPWLLIERALLNTAKTA